MGIIRLLHHSVCECPGWEQRHLAALALKVVRCQASLQSRLLSLDSPISCKPGGEADNGPHPRVGGFVPGRGAALSWGSRMRVQFSHRIRQYKVITLIKNRNIE